MSTLFRTGHFLRFTHHVSRFTFPFNMSLFLTEDVNSDQHISVIEID